MLIILTYLGIIKYNPVMKMFVKFDAIHDLIENSSYIYGWWFFQNVSKIFKDSYCIAVKGGLKNVKTVKKLIKKLEEKEGVTLSNDIKKQIFDNAEKSIKATEDKNIKQEGLDYDKNHITNLFQEYKLVENVDYFKN